jgi:V/A-type H+-transporting ATPase subunit A
MHKEQNASAHVIAVQDDIVSIRSSDLLQTALMKNEVIYILPKRRGDLPYQPYLKAEVLRIKGDTAEAQVYETTSGVAIGDPVVQSGEMLSVELGPGLLGQVYDGLQNPLDVIAGQYGFFLPKGIDIPALDNHKKWAFTPAVHSGERLKAGAVIGSVVENQFRHKIMLPFDLIGEVELCWIQEGNVTVDEAVAQIQHSNGHIQNITLKQDWPVRVPLPKHLLKNNLARRQYPQQPLITQLRLIDTFFPIARGGTGCIPGPFGAGKTVLQNLLAKNSDVDIVIVVACGERAGEVVETINTFPQLKDPKGSGSLMDRTIIICNTSSMPVAAREASIYTGITLGEYYRQMGLDVLLIADSTSRWAQAMRETSGRLEEIPGEEAFPAYLDSAIKTVYERAGVIETSPQNSGSLTMIGTVSPAGGNFEEPVTQATLSTVKTFLGLSSERAYKHFYPAIDPLISWSRYLEQLQEWYQQNLEAEWTQKVQQAIALLKQGDEVLQMIQVAGEEGITLDDFVIYLKAEFIDWVYLQQDAFDPVDVAVPIVRQHENFSLLSNIIMQDFGFEDRASARHFFMQLSHLFKNLNYAPYQSKEYLDLLDKIKQLARISHEKK